MQRGGTRRRWQRKARRAEPHEILQSRACLKEEVAAPIRVEAEDWAAVGGSSDVARILIAPKGGEDSKPISNVLAVGETQAAQPLAEVVPGSGRGEANRLPQ